jgi:predicted nucleic acid-binding protein
MCLAAPSDVPLTPVGAIRLFRSLPDYEVALVDYVRRSASEGIALTPQWEQMPEGTIRDCRTEIYARGVELSYSSRRGSLFDMAYAALAEQAGTSMWTIDERFYHGARAQGLAFVVHPGHDPLP